MATDTPPSDEGPTPRSAQLFHRMTVVLAVISVMLIVLGLVQFVSFLEWRNTRSCLETVAAQGKASRDSAIVWLEDTRKLIAGPQQPQAETAFLTSLDTYHDALETANANTKCLDHTEGDSQ